MTTTLLEPKRKKKPQEGKRPKNVFEAIDRNGDDSNFEPLVTPKSKKHFAPTAAAPGSAEKVEVLRERLEKGLPLWHKKDRRDFKGIKIISFPAQPAVEVDSALNNLLMGSTLGNGLRAFDPTGVTQAALTEQDPAAANPAASAPGQHAPEQTPIGLGRGNAHSKGHAVMQSSGAVSEVERRARIALEQKLKRKREALQGGNSKIDYHRGLPPASKGEGLKFSAPPPPPAPSIRHESLPSKSVPAQQVPPSTEGLAALQAPKMGLSSFTPEQREILRMLASLEASVRNNYVTDTVLKEFKQEHHTFLSQVKLTGMCA